MAVLCWLIESGIKPFELHLFYAHFDEHSPDTFKFVADGIRYARKHFDNVKVKITHNNVLKYFENEKLIPHPANSPCSKKLKIYPINDYAFQNDIKIDLVGYVKHELKKRADKQQKQIAHDLFSLSKLYPIGNFTDEWCFEIVDKHIGWHPKIYDLKWNDAGFVEYLNSILPMLPESVRIDINRKIGTNTRVFKHNNCLPCKNMYPYEIIAVHYFYNSYYINSIALSHKLKRYWGRDKDEFYCTFGRDLGQESTCEICKY